MQKKQKDPTRTWYCSLYIKEQKQNTHFRIHDPEQILTFNQATFSQYPKLTYKHLSCEIGEQKVEVIEKDPPMKKSFTLKMSTLPDLNGIIYERELHISKKERHGCTYVVTREGSRFMETLEADRAHFWWERIFHFLVEDKLKIS